MRQVSATIAFLSTLWESRSMAHHNEIVRESFTVQAKACAANPWVTDKQRIRRLVAAARLTGDEHVLDIATGPGYIAEAIPSEPPIRTVGRNCAILRMFERFRSASYCIFSATRDWKPIASRRLKIFARKWSDGWLPPGYPRATPLRCGASLKKIACTTGVVPGRFWMLPDNGTSTRALPPSLDEGSGS